MPYTFSGSQILQCPADLLPAGASPRTVALTMNSAAPANPGAILCYGYEGYGNFVGIDQGESPSCIGYTQYGDGDQIDFDCTDGADHRFVLVCDGTNVTIYANGTSHTKAISSLYAGLDTIVAGYKLYLGSFPSGASNFIGTLAEVLIYDSALAGSDLSAVIAGSSAPGSPICYWPLSGGDLTNHGSLGSAYNLLSPYGGGNPFDSQVFQGVTS